MFFKDAIRAGLTVRDTYRDGKSDDIVVVVIAAHNAGKTVGGHECRKT